MCALTRDGTAEAFARDKILRRKRGQGKNIFSVELTTSRIGNHTRLISQSIIIRNSMLTKYTCTITAPAQLLQRYVKIYWSIVFSVVC